MSEIDVVQLLKDLVENLYFRAAHVNSVGNRDEYMAIKGVQHAIEDALLKHGITTNFRRPKDGRSPK